VRKGMKNHLLIHPLRVLNQRRLYIIIIVTNEFRMDTEKPLNRKMQDIPKYPDLEKLMSHWLKNLPISFV
jgi:hypothetical protein